MSEIKRPSPRPIFLESARRLNVKFYTSNLQKYLQAKLVFEKFGLVLHHFRSRVEPYSENYELGKERLLIVAVDEIKSHLGKGSLFFVEDTSLRIEALSKENEDVPGLAVKEWFAKTTFQALNRRLPKKIAERSVTVKSDIALHVPGLSDPVIFHGETPGTVALTAPAFEEDHYHPWLTPNSFNGWFVPNGSRRRLGEMSLEESWSYDFRIRALTALVSRLEEYAAILNAPRDCYSHVRSFPASTDQLSLFEPRPLRIFIIVGPTCSGKTTFGELVEKENPDFKVIEASAVVRSFMIRRDQDLSAFDFASQLLREKGPDIVARKIISMFHLKEGGTFIITGFRTIEELETIQNVAPQTKVVLIQSSERTRYARFLKRGRSSPMSYKEFIAHDKKQWAFGLLRIAEDFADVKISNEDSKDVYHSQIQSALNGAPHTAPGVSVNVGPRHQLSVHRLFRCLSILSETGQAMTCEEIEERTKGNGKLLNSQLEAGQNSNTGGISRFTGKRITHNNVNKVLKQAPELAQRLEADFDRVRYKVTDTGRAYIRLMQKYADMRI